MGVVANVVKVLDRSVVYVEDSGRGVVLSANGVTMHRFIRHLGRAGLQLQTRSQTRTTLWRFVESAASVGGVGWQSIADRGRGEDGGVALDRVVV